MSIFTHSDIDNILFIFLTIDDKCILSKVNNYYRRALWKELTQYRLFFSDTSAFMVHRLVYGYECELLIRAICNGVLDICKYVNRKYYDNDKMIHGYRLGFEIACCHENYDIIDWLLGISDIAAHNIDFCIYTATKQNRWNMVNFLKMKRIQKKLIY